MENKKIITFKESYHGEAYVAFTENKTETYIFEKFLSWLSKYAHSSFSDFFFLKRITLKLKFVFIEKRKNFYLLIYIEVEKVIQLL